MTEIEKHVTEGEIIPTIGNWAHVRNTRWQGAVQIWKNIASGEHIAISRAHTFDRGDETMIFPYDAEANKVSDWGELYAGYGQTHEDALRDYVAGDDE